MVWECSHQVDLTRGRALGEPVDGRRLGPAREEADTTGEGVVDTLVSKHVITPANVAMATGDTAALRALSTPECSCLRLAESIEELYGSGGRAEGARWDLEDLTVVDVTGASASVRVGFLAPGYQEIGRTPKSIPSQRFASLVSLTLDSGWRIADWDKLSEGPA